MFGNAKAIAAIARLANKQELALMYDAKAVRLRELVEQQLWDQDARFFKARLDTNQLASVREEIGFTPGCLSCRSPGMGSRLPGSN